MFSQSFLFASLVSVIFLGCSPLGPQKGQLEVDQGAAPAIIGGEPVAENELRNVISLVKNGRSFCTGSLIHPQIVITAAHCVSSGIQGVSLYSGSGDQEAVLESNLPEISRAVLHPEYKQGFEGNYDIAILILRQPVENIQPFEILTEVNEIHQSLSPGQPVTLAGFGRREDSSSGLKYQVQVLVHERKAYEILVSDKGKGACHGDSGGPAFAKDGKGELKLFGVTSRGPALCSYDGADHTTYGLLHPALCWIEKESGFKVPSSRSLGCEDSVSEAPRAETIEQYCSQQMTQSQERTLRVLSLQLGKTSCVETLQALSEVKTLKMGPWSLRDLSPFKYATNLESLDLTSNDVRNLLPLAELTQLKSIVLHDNSVERGDLENFSEKKPGVRMIGKESQKGALNESNLVRFCEETDAEDPLIKALFRSQQIFQSRSQCRRLNRSLVLGTYPVDELSWGGFKIESLDFLPEYLEVKKLDLSNNQIANIDKLLKLESLEEVDLNFNQISPEDPSVLKLKEKGIRVHLEHYIQLKDSKFLEVCKAVEASIRAGDLSEEPVARFKRAVAMIDSLFLYYERRSCEAAAVTLKQAEFLFIEDAADVEPFFSDMERIQAMAFGGSTQIDLRALLKLPHTEIVLSIRPALAESQKEVVQDLKSRGMIVTTTP